MAELVSIKLPLKPDDLVSSINKNFTELELRKVDNELKTGSTTQYKVLSDNNFTDEEKTKLSKTLTSDTKYAFSLEMSYTQNTGILKSILKDQNGNELSNIDIDFPTEQIVKSGEVKTCVQNDVPVQGYVVGDKYIDFTLISDEHLYVLVSDLVDQMTVQKVGTGNVVTDISVEGNVIKVTMGTISSKTTIDFTADNENWSAVDSEGFYTLTLTKSADYEPTSVLKLANDVYSQVMVGLSYSSTQVFIKTNEKFVGRIILI